MTRVKIKLKGQFYGMTGEIVKRQNQYSFGVKFDNLKGVYPFGHRSLEIVDAGANIESEALKSIGEKLQELKAKIAAEKERHAKYNTDAAIQGRATCELIEGWVKELFHV
jgi:hypothetical protein